jgi:hypothetical protein
LAELSALRKLADQAALHRFLLELKRPASMRELVGMPAPGAGVSRQDRTPG